MIRINHMKSYSLAAALCFVSVAALLLFVSTKSNTKLSPDGHGFMFPGIAASISISPDGTKVAAIGNRTLRIYSMTSNEMIWNRETAHDETFGSALEWSPDNSFLVFGVNHSLVAFHVPGLTEVVIGDTDHNRITQVEFISEQTFIAAGIIFGDFGIVSSLEVWGYVPGTTQLTAKCLIRRQEANARCFSFGTRSTTNRRWLAIGYDEGGIADIYKISPGRLCDSNWTSSIPAEEEGWLEIADDGEWVVSKGRRRVVFWLRGLNGQYKSEWSVEDDVNGSRSYPMDDGNYHSLAVCNHGELIAASFQAGLSMFDRLGNRIGRNNIQTGGVCWNADGTRLLAAHDGTIQKYRVPIITIAGGH